MKLEIPMMNKTYILTNKEQLLLSCKYNLSIATCSELINEFVNNIPTQQIKTANKLKLALESYIENSNVKALRAV